MASPQAENGHIDIANEIAEALCRVNLSAYETRILWALLRKTYGWHKKNDGISLSQFTEITHIPDQNVARTIKQLERRNIIKITRNGSGRGHYNSYEFQKDYSKWLDIDGETLSIQIVSNEIVSNEIVSNQIQNTINPDNQILSNQIDTKETIQKKLIQKKGTSKISDKKYRKDTVILSDKDSYDTDPRYTLDTPVKRGKYQNVLLSDVEYTELVEEYPGNESAVSDMIETLSEKMVMNPKKYHYSNFQAAIRNWIRTSKKFNQPDSGNGDRPSNIRYANEWPKEL